MTSEGEELITMFREWLDRKGLRESSVYMYSHAVKSFLAGQPDIDDIESFNDYLVKHAIERRSNYVYAAFRHFIDFAHESEAQRARLKRKLIKPKVQDPKRMTRFLSPDMRERIIMRIRHHKHKLMAMVQSATGVRASDVLRLRTRHVEFEEYNGKLTLRIVFEGKGGRMNPMWVFDRGLQDALQYYIGNLAPDEEFLFLDRSGRGSKTPFSLLKNNYLRYLRDLKQSLTVLGISYHDFATHDWRRAFARKVWELHKDPHLLKNALHHRSFRTTERYLRDSGMQNVELLEEMEENR